MTNQQNHTTATAVSLSRRTLLAALPATGAALSLPTAAAAHEPDPLVALYHDWLDNRRAWCKLAEMPGNENWDHPMMDDHERRELAAEEQILASTPVSLEGIAVLATLAWDNVEPSHSDPEYHDKVAQHLDCKAVLAIWRACAGQEGYPVTR